MDFYAKIFFFYNVIFIKYSCYSRFWKFLTSHFKDEIFIILVGLGGSLSSCFVWDKIVKNIENSFNNDTYFFFYRGIFKSFFPIE